MPTGVLRAQISVCSNTGYEKESLLTEPYGRLVQMGLKDYMSEKAIELAAYAAAEVAERGAKAISAAYNSEERVEARKSRAAYRESKRLEKAEARDAQYMARRPKNTFLYVKMEKTGSNALLKITDTFENVLYTATGTISKSTVNLRVRSEKKDLISTIKKARFIVRNPLYVEENPADYDLVVDGINTGTVKSANYDKRGCFYEIDPFGWAIDYGGGGYAVKDGDVNLFFFDNRLGYSHPTYLVDFRDPSIEQMAVLVTLAVLCHRECNDL